MSKKSKSIGDSGAIHLLAVCHHQYPTETSSLEGW